MVCGSSEYPLHIPAFSRCLGNGGVASGWVSSTSLGICRDPAERSINRVLLSTSALLLGSSRLCTGHHVRAVVVRFNLSELDSVQPSQADRILDCFHSGDPFSSELRHSQHGPSAL